MPQPGVVWVLRSAVLFGMLRASARVVLSLLLVIFKLSSAFASYTVEELRNLETQTEIQEREALEQEVFALRESLGQNAPKNIKNGLRFRLADLSFKHYQALLLLAARKNVAAQAEETLEPMGVKSLLKEIIRSGEEILRSELAFDELPRVYFMLGFAYKELGDADLAFHHFSQLRKKFPKSRSLLAQSDQQVGDLKYQEQKYYESLEAYEKALSGLEKHERPAVRAKMSWSHYKAGDHKQALQLMKDVIATATRPSDRAKALQDLAQFMTELGKTKDAVDYFSRVSSDPSFYLKTLKQLLVRAQKRNAPEEEIPIYSALIQLHPKAQAGLLARIQWLELELKRKRYPQALALLAQIRFSHAHSSLTPDWILESASRVRADILKSISVHQQLFRMSQKRADLEVVKSLYQGYLAFVVRENLKMEIPEIRMLLADTQKALKENAEATELYRLVAESLDRRFAKQGALLWLSGLTEELRTSASSSVAGPSTWSAAERKLVACLDFILSHWEESLKKVPQVREAALRAAQIVAKDPAKSTEASERAESVMEQWPDTLEGLAAAQLWLSLLSDERSLTSGLETVRGNSKLLDADRRLQRGKFGVFLKEQDQRLRLWDIVHSEKKQDYSIAGLGYEAYGDESSKAEIFEPAYANAIRNLLKNTSTQSIVVRVATHWIEKNSGSSKAIETLKMAAAEALVRGNFELAADLYEQVGKDLRDPGALESAARIFEGLLNFERLKFDWTQYLALFGEQPNWGLADLELGKLLEAQNLNSEAIEVYLKCVQRAPYFQAECEARLGDLYLKLQDVTEAGLRYRRGSVLDLSSPFTTYARFQLGLLLEQSAVLAALDPDSSGLQKQIEERQARLELLKTSFGFAAAGQGPWAVAGLHRLALAYRQLALELDGVHASLGETKEVQEKFNRPLRALSKVLNQNAKTFWSQAYTQSLAQESYSAVMGEVLEGLAQLRPKASGRKHGILGTQGALQFKGKVQKKGGFKLAGVEFLNLESPSFFKFRERLLREPGNSQLWVDFGNALGKFRKPIFAQIAYERALSLQPDSAAALNNLAVILLGEQDRWDSVWKAATLLRKAAVSDGFEARFNLATLMNYYYQFEKARPLWTALHKRHHLPEVSAGAALAEQGQRWVQEVLGVTKRGKHD